MDCGGGRVGSDCVYGKMYIEAYRYPVDAVYIHILYIVNQIINDKTSSSYPNPPHSNPPTKNPYTTPSPQNTHRQPGQH